MVRVYLALVDIVPAAVVLVPLHLVFYFSIYRRKLRRSVLSCLFCLYLSAVFALVGIPNVTYIRPELNLNLIPLAGMLADFKNSILNVLLFIPLGIMLPLLWNKFKTLKFTLLFGFGMSSVIELLQALTFRATDVNDLITNTLGTFLGFFCANALLARFPAIKQLAADTEDHDVILVTVIILLLMFFVYPFISAAFWDLLLP